MTILSNGKNAANFSKKSLQKSKFLKERVFCSSVTTLFLAGCSSAEPVSASSSGAKLGIILISESFGVFFSTKFACVVEYNG